MSEELWEPPHPQHNGVNHYTTFFACGFYGLVVESCGEITASIVLAGRSHYLKRNISSLQEAKEWCIVELMKRKALA